MDEVRKQGCEGVTDLPEGFKMTELGPLPEEWEVIRLGDVARFETGKRERGGAQSQGEVFSVGGEHITEDGRLDFSSLKFISRRFYEKLNSGKVKPGDTLVCKDGARTGKSAFIREIPSSGLAVNEHVFIVRPVNAQLYDEFLGYWFLSEQAWQQLRVACHGLIGGITREDISNFILPLPPLYEQRAIAHVLRTVQRAKEATERVIQATRELKKSLMRYLFTYGPVPMEEAERVPLKETEIGLVPEHWEVVRLGDFVRRGVLALRNGFAQGRHNESGKGIPHLRPFNIDGDGNLTMHQVKYVPPPPPDSPYWLQIGDVIFNNTNSEELVGKTAYFDQDVHCVLSNHMTLIRVMDASIIDSYWLSRILHFLYQCGIFRLLCRRHVNQVSVSLERLQSLYLPFPPLPEQHKIARILQAVDKKLQAEEARKQALEELFKTLLHNLMTGKIRVKDLKLPEIKEVQ